MTVHTRVGRRSGVSVPVWTLPFLLPFFILWGVFALFVLLTRLSIWVLWYVGLPLVRWTLTRGKRSG